MRPPGRIKLGGQTWTVITRAFDGDLNLYGRTRARQALIQLDPDQSATQARDTMLHELLHACVSNTPLNLSDEDEERVVRGITPWLLAALRDNPRLVAYLTER